MHERWSSLCATACWHVSSDTSVFNSKAESYSNQALSVTDRGGCWQFVSYLERVAKTLFQSRQGDKFAFSRHVTFTNASFARF
jgi:hypothetical protein